MGTDIIVVVLSAVQAADNPAHIQHVIYRNLIELFEMPPVALLPPKNQYPLRPFLKSPWMNWHLQHEHLPEAPEMNVSIGSKWAAAKKKQW